MRSFKTKLNSTPKYLNNALPDGNVLLRYLADGNVFDR